MLYPIFLHLLVKIIIIFSGDGVLQSNKLIKEAEMHFLQKNYLLALSTYEKLHNRLSIKDAHVLLNLAHCYYQIGDTAKAKKMYLSTNFTTNPQTGSVVYQQLGVMSFKNKEYGQALAHFKNALVAHPGNQTARYNYELVKKLLAKRDTPTQDTLLGQSPQSELQPEENPPGDLAPQASETNTNQQAGFNHDKTEESTTSEVMHDRLKNINLSKDKAEMILDAMKNTEIQYIQQRKKTSAKPSGKHMPDW